jgi:amino acid adenylation domain-containing protein
LNTQKLSAAERLALLELLEATAPKQAAPTVSQIEPVDRSGPLPLSFAQWRLWFLDQLGIPGALYHMPTHLRLQGELDRDALLRALNRLVERHETLRTTFAEEDAEQVQRIVPAEESPFQLADHDLRGHPEAGAELRRLLAEDAAVPFDLACGPLIRGQLIRLADDDQVVLINMHHIVSDGWSMGVFTRELSALYAAFRAGEPDPLPALPIQYADYAVWQRRWVDGDVLKAQAEYWKETLAGAPALLELPTDRPRPPRQDFSGGETWIELDAELTAGLKALSHRHGATLYMTILAGWAVVLSRLSGQESVVVGTPVAGRGRREIEGLIGFFVNTLAIRVDLAGSPAVAELLRRAKERALEAQDHQDIPFEQVVELLQPVRSLAHTPLFQVMFNWLNMPERELELSGLALAAEAAPGSAPRPEPAAQSASATRPGEPSDASAQFDLTLSLFERGGRITGALEYAVALFDPETIERHVEYLRRVLAQMVADERRTVARLELMSPPERAQVVEAWNATELPSPDGACVHELFERRAEETPGATALVFEGGALTYAELDARANRLAHRLRALGVGPDARVAICAERTPQLVAGLLAVLKAGGAYVPLDPAYPEERLRWLLADSAPVAVLAHASLAARFAGAGVPVLELDAGSPAWAAGPETNPGRGALLPEHLAYVIYTSGSTGRPKGVMVPHRAVGRQAAAVQAGFGLRADDRVLQFASVAFDAAVEEIFGALLTGAALVLRTEAWLEGAHAFWGRCAENGVTVADLPTRFWQLLLDEPAAAVPECVRLLAIGGEAVEPAALEAWFRRDGYRPRLLNTYGPTETTVNATLGEVAADPATWRSIGRPVANTRTYLLDAGGEPVPVGVSGELYIGGGQVARGYLDRPGLTAERFVPDPFAREPGARLYRTGDLVRWRADGSIEFLGRTDFQVKIRGFRIELGEIEARLSEYPAVRDAVVLAREDVPGDRQLVAYCVGDEGLDVEALRAHLAGRLPSYMVPAAFVRLDAFPVTAGGKVDRRALPSPKGDALAMRGYEAPAGETEQAVADIWAEVLKVERVGRRDSFFDLGGHSLLAVQVISRVRQRLAVEVALRDLFARSVLADFARGLETASRAELPPIEPVERGGDFPLSFAQQRLWFVERLAGAGTAFHIPVGQRLCGELDRGALRRALDRIVARHEALRTVFAEVDGAPVQRIAPAEENPFHLAEHDLRGHADGPAELRRLAAEEARAPFDLERGPLIRGRLVQIGDDDHVLFVTMHHIVSDGWSMGVFTRELGALYGAFRAGRPDPLPPLAVQYADYAAWQRRWVEGDVLREQAEYWKTTLSGAPELLELPADHPRPARQDFIGATVPLVLDEALSAALRELSRRHRTTLFMTLLAGWAAVLARLSGQDDVVVGTPTANRGREEIEGLIGFFVNMLPVRVELSDAPTVAALLARVKERALGAQHHQDIPFEQVVDLVHPARSMAYAPLFQAIFAWQNAPAGAGGAGLPGLSPAPAGPAGPPDRPGAGPPAPAQLPQATAQVDLTLMLWEHGGRIAGNVTYATALFERETVERYVGTLGRVLEGMVAEEHRPVDRLPLLPEAERRLVVEEWNATGRAYPTGGVRVHDLFRAQAARTPHAAALSWRGERLTYAELERRANRIANVLRRRGVGPEVRVGICLPRTPDLVAAMLGVLGAGGAYVPLDPAYPRERLGYMAEDAAITLVITDSALADRFADGAATLLLDRDRDAIAAESADAPESGVLPENLSHVIFTSGSTGRPKGVMIRHSSVVVLLHWLRENVTDEERSSVLFSTSINFDVSVAEVFGTLAWGGKLVLVENALELATVGEDVVHVSMVPSAAAELLRSGGIPSSVKTLNLGGEALPNALAQGLYGLETVAKVGNLYGPTEDTTYSTYYVVPRGAEQVLVGTPVANTRAYVLDAHLQPVPVGAVGELYLAGDGLSRGYANRPAMTAERFVPCPFGPPGARMYRVMDRVRRRADGEIEYLGRLDFQVKVRGYRIELGEIEARLAEHAGVRAPVVLVREDAPGDRRLVAYYRADEPVAVDALKAHLSDRLPEYMVPAAYVRMEALPLTPNGKVDRKALPAPEGDAYGAHAYAAPVGETEAALAGIWAEVLGVERVGRHDNFFELGGHSLLAVQVISRMRQVLGVEAPLAHLFSHPTVESLSALVSGSEPRVQEDRAIPIRPSGSQPPLFLAYEGAGSIAYAQVLHPHVDAEIPVYALPAPSPADAPLRTVEGMATRLVRMIREVQPSGPYRLGGWSFGGVLAYEVAAQLIGRDETVEFVGMFDSYHPVRVRGVSHDPAQEHAQLLHVLRMAETVDSNGPVDPDEAGVPTGAEELETFVTRCREKGLLPGHVTVEQARQMRDHLRGNAVALREYSPQPLPVAVHLFPAGQSGDPDLSRGWQATLPAAQLRVTPVPGTHLSMMRAPNVATLGEALSRAIGRAREEAPRSAEGSSPVVTLQGGDRVAPLFCIPGAGSGVTSFIDLMLALDPAVPVHGLQPRGTDGEALPHATVQAAAEHYLRALREACPTGPIHLLGHSFGGWVAFEMALRLHEAGRPVASLTILDSEVPDDSEDIVREYGAGEAFLKLVEVLELTVERSLGIGPADVASRDEAGWLKLLHGKMVAFGLLGARATPDVLTGPFRAFARCLRTTYRPLGVYPARLRLVLVDDPKLDEAANRANFAAVERGWRKWAPGLVFSIGAGNHITALKAPHVATLAGLLAEDRGAREG